MVDPDGDNRREEGVVRISVVGRVRLLLEASWET